MTGLRIAAVLDQEVRVGGGFQQALNDLIWLRDWARDSGDELRVHVFHKQSVAILATFGIAALLSRPGALDFVFLGLKYSTFFSFLQKGLKWSSPLERRIAADGADLVYFLTQSKWHLVFDHLPYAITIFDNCHRDAPEFPEVRAYGEFERREQVYRLAVNKSCLVVVNAAELVDKLVRRYALDPVRCVVLPFQPSVFVTTSENAPVHDSTVMGELGIQPGYLFYPAQLWPHKNHVSLLRAVARLRERAGTAPPVVLAGGDKGAGSSIKALAEALGLDVTFLGFVASEKLPALYRQSLALVMPSYFGPTNLPPLEAWWAGAPVIYPSAFAEQVGDAALLFDFDDPETLAAAIERVQIPAERARLLQNGRRRLRELDAEREQGRRAFDDQMRRLRYRLIGIRV